MGGASARLLGSSAAPAASAPHSLFPYRAVHTDVRPVTWPTGRGAGTGLVHGWPDLMWAWYFPGMDLL